MNKIRTFSIVGAIVYTAALLLYEYRPSLPAPSPSGPCAATLRQYATNLSAACESIAKRVDSKELKTPEEVVKEFNVAEATFTSTFDELNTYLDDHAGENMEKIGSAFHKFAESYKELGNE